MRLPLVVSRYVAFWAITLGLKTKKKTGLLQRSACLIGATQSLRLVFIILPINSKQG